MPGRVVSLHLLPFIARSFLYPCVSFMVFLPAAYLPGAGWSQSVRCPLRVLRGEFPPGVRTAVCQTVWQYYLCAGGQICLAEGQTVKV